MAWVNQRKSRGRGNENDHRERKVPGRVLQEKGRLFEIAEHVPSKHEEPGQEREFHAKARKLGGSTSYHKNLLTNKFGGGNGDTAKVKRKKSEDPSRGKQQQEEERNQTPKWRKLKKRERQGTTYTSISFQIC